MSNSAPSDPATIALVVDHVAQAIGDRVTWDDYPGGWPGEIEIALLDAVFSANATYGKAATNERAATGVFKVIGNWRKARQEETLDSLTALVLTAEGLGVESLPEVLDNRQVVPGGALRKGIAVYEAAKKLLAVGVDHADDLADPQTRDAATTAYTSVPGLGWVTFDYFLSLLGHPTVKADRMIIAFVGHAVGHPVTSEQARDLLLAVAEVLNVEDPRVLDHAVWAYQRDQPTEKG